MSSANSVHSESGSNAQDEKNDRVDAIREGKLKAKEVVAAASMDNDTRAESPQQPAQRAASGSPAAAQNGTEGAPAGKKRSRSGSVISNHLKPARNTEGESLKGGQAAENLEREDEGSRAEAQLEEYTKREELEVGALQQQEERSNSLYANILDEINQWTLYKRAGRDYDPGWIYGQGFAGFGNGWTRTNQQQHRQVVTPVKRKRPGNRKTRELRPSRRDRLAQAEQLDELVPIRLDLEVDKLRLRDTFTWNLNDRTVPPELFAQGLIEDFQIPPEASNTFAQQVYHTMQEQIQDHHPHPFPEEESLDPHLPYTAYKDDEMRILIKINVTIGNHTLIDQFDWDINNNQNSPEEFAKHLTADLCLSGEFTTAVAHSIREQAQLYTKSLYISGHTFDGRPIENFDLRENLLPSPLPSPFRTYQSAKEFAPSFYELSNTALERAEDAFSREQRQQKRSVNRKGGPNLPDLKERLRTVRTQVVSTLVPGAVESVEHSGIHKPTRSSTARGRRANRADRGDESDVSESDESEEDEAARSHALQGTARTRGMRGAASAAQAAMRANLTDPMTPEHHDPPRPQRRTGGYEIREDSVTGEISLLLRLKMPREKYRRWWREYKAKRAAMQQAEQQRLQQQQQQLQQQLQMQKQAQSLQNAQFAQQHQQVPFQGPQQQYNMAGPGQMGHAQQAINQQQHGGFGSPFQRPSSNGPNSQAQRQQPPQAFPSGDGANESNQRIG